MFQNVLVFNDDVKVVADGLYKSVVKTHYKIEPRYVQEAEIKNANVFIIRFKLF